MDRDSPGAFESASLSSGPTPQPRSFQLHVFFGGFVCEAALQTGKNEPPEPG
jgi:hypothetical protein